MFWGIAPCTLVFKYKLFGGASASSSGTPNDRRQQRPQKRSILHGVISHATADVLCLIALCLTLPSAKQGQHEKMEEGCGGGGGGHHN